MGWMFSMAYKWYKYDINVQYVSLSSLIAHLHNLPKVKHQRHGGHSWEERGCWLLGIYLLTLYVSILKNDETWDIDFTAKKIHHLSLSQSQFLVHFILTSSSRLFDHSGRPASENGNDAEDDAPRKRLARSALENEWLPHGFGSGIYGHLISLISLKCSYTTSKVGIRWNYSFSMN